KPVIQRQRRLNPNMKDVIKKEIIKLLDAGIIYAIEDSPWVSLLHSVPKKGGMTVVTNEDNELVPTRTVSGWRVCIDYQNVPVDHLSRLEKPNLKELKDEEISDEFPNEFPMSIKDEEESMWFSDFTNYLVGGISRKGLTYAQRCKFFSELKHYFWDEPYLFKACPHGMIRRCVYSLETRKILDECHHRPTGGHYGPSITIKKVFDAGFYWPTIFKEAQTMVQNCDACQRSGSNSRRDEMPLNNI
nr:reverse transcriptase domain-containing protein [Tanacetum cinerariifolium]